MRAHARSAAARAPTPYAPRVGTEDYYHADDLRVGSRISVLSRDMLIYDADEFTYDWCAGAREKAFDLS